MHCAANRKESRGAHMQEDYPKRDDKNWMKHTVAWFDGWGGKGGGVKIDYRPVHEFTLTDDIEYIKPKARVTKPRGFTDPPFVERRQAVADFHYRIVPTPLGCFGGRGRGLMRSTLTALILLTLAGAARAAEPYHLIPGAVPLDSGPDGNTIVLDAPRA